MTRFFLILLAGFVFSGCSKVAEEINWNGGFDGVFSDRPQKNEGFVTLLRLQNPPLLSALKTENGKKLVDTELAAAIELEQANLINQLSRISSEIKVVFKYRLVLNAIAIAAPASVEDKINALQGVTVEKSQIFARPLEVNKDVTAQNIADGITSVSFIGAHEAHSKGFKGKGIRVGIIDTGIDYTHAMLGGPGSSEVYESIDPSQPSPLFPNAKVVGGIDLAGTDFDASTPIFKNRIAKPDPNPLDESGHGTHVAGTVAGLGNGENSYSGVAPEALLYAIKTFGANGATSDEVVIAGLEYAADPNKDLNLDDQLHVVNLSLGSGYGHTHIMYNEAIKNLSDAGTVVVASAGNSGPIDFITGSPGASDNAFSVAASIDNMSHNWQFPATQFTFSDGEVLKTIAIEGANSTPVAEAAITEGELFYIGLADIDLTPEQVEQLKGKVALIDRGKVTFMEKLKRAQDGGAVAAVVVNSEPGEPIPMGGDGKVEIPAVMISLDAGKSVKTAMEKGPVVVNLKTSDFVSKPELIDTPTDFSSKGPRSLDAFLKPEIIAPGQNIISAEMGGGNKTVKMSGTSMSAPHIAGVMALMKEAHKDKSSLDLQSMVMGTSKTLVKDQKTIPLSIQGAGRVQVDKAIAAPMATSPTALSLGIIGVDKSKTLQRNLTLKNITQEAMNLTLKFEGHAALRMDPMTVSLEPQTEKTISVRLVLSAAQLNESVTEVDGFIKIFSQDEPIFKVAVLALAEKVSAVKATSLVVEAGSMIDAPESVVKLKLKNSSSHEGEALLFNKIDVDSRKPAPHGVQLSRICDLQAAGYRIIGNKVQFAIKLYEPITSWQLCEISVLFDSNGDKLAEQELVGIQGDRLDGIPLKEMKSLLLDAAKAREIRKQYEDSLEANPEETPAGPNYIESVIGLGNMLAYHNTTVAVVEVDKSLIATRSTGEVAFKIATTSADSYNTEMDDFLTFETRWRTMDMTEKAQGFFNLPESVKVPGNQEVTVDFVKGYGPQSLMILYPQNANSLGTLLNDKQMENPRLKLAP